MRTEIHAL